jgi:uncharacterized membrane protein
VIGNGDSNLGGFRGFHWTESGRTIVAPPVVTHDSYAYGLSADGVYVAAASRYLSGVQWKSFRWHAPNVIEQLPFPSGAEHVIAASISGDGTTIIGHTYILGKQRAFRWTAAAGLVNIDAQAPASRVRSYAQAVNHNGSVIVGTLETTQAFVWTAANGLFELAPYLQSHGTDLTGWTLAEARGISADGSAIAGTGFFQGQKRAFLVRGLHLIACGIADVGGVGGTIGNDGVLDNNDFVAFITLFFAHDPRADVGAQGGALGPDGLFDNNDFVVYIDSFFDGC